VLLFILLAAVDQDALTVDVGGALACQEGDDFADLIGLCQAVHGACLAHGFLYMVGHSVEHLGLGSSRCHTVDGDALTTGFLCQGVGKTHNGCLGGSVVALTGIAAGSIGAHVNDTTVAVFTHLGIQTVGPVKDTVQVGVDNLQPLLLGHLVEDGIPGDGGVVDKDIYSAEFLHDLCDGCVYLVRVGHITLDGEGDTAQLLGSLAGCLVVVVYNGDAFDVFTDKDLCGGLAMPLPEPVITAILFFSIFFSPILVFGSGDCYLLT